MTTHDDLFAVSAQDVLEYQHGGTHTLTVAGEQPKALTMMLTAVEEIRDETTGVVIKFTRMATISKTSLGTSKPQINSTVQISGESWSVESKPADNGAFVTLSLMRNVVSEVSRPDYRRF